MKQPIAQPLWQGTSRNREQTLRLGQLLARCLQAGDLLALEGELGVGKTQLVRGLAQGLGIPQEQVASPTFVLVHEYPIPHPPFSPALGFTQAASGPPKLLVHVDAYRLQSLEDLESIGWSSQEADRGNGLAELRRQAVVVIEWADKLGLALGEDLLRIRLTHAGAQQRRIQLFVEGSWLERQEVLLQSLAGGPEPTHACPICGKALAGQAPTFPFCSDRCRMVDLEKWLGGHYRISRPLEQRDLEEGQD